MKRVGIMFSPNNAPSAKTAKDMQEEVWATTGPVRSANWRVKGGGLC
jgi:hypothetical protein